MRFDFEWSKALITSVVAVAVVACGGGGSGTPATSPPATQPAFGLVGPQDTDPVEFACGNRDGDKTNARYPAAGDNPSLTLAALPDGRVMGRNRAGTGPAGGPNDPYTYFWIDQTGRRTTYTARPLDNVRVDMDGQLWWVGPDKVLWRGTLQPSGQDERIGIATAFGSVPSDGLSSQLALGQLKGFAGTQGAVFLLVMNDSGTQYFVRRMSRDANANWQSTSIAVPTNVAQSGDTVTLMANRRGQLALVVQRSIAIGSGEASHQVSYWQWQADNVWREVAYQVWTSTVSSGIYESLKLDSATLDDDGNVIWGGGGNATLYKMGQDGSWTVLARPGNISATAVGQEGDRQKATFLSAYSVASGPGGSLLFYDAETCQVRKLTNQVLTTVSGPSYTIRPHFAGATLVGFDDRNALISGHTARFFRTSALDHNVPRPTMASFDLANNRLTALDAVGSLEASANDSCSWSIGPFPNRSCTQFNLWGGVSDRFAGLDSATGIAYLMGTTNISRLDGTASVEVATVPTTICSSASGPTLQFANSFASSQPDFPYFVVSRWSCPDPNGVKEIVPTLYRFDVASGILQAVFPGKRPDLVDGEANFLQKRTDGGFWMAGSMDMYHIVNGVNMYGPVGGVIRRLTSGGDRMFVAGNFNRPAQAKDGQDSAAEFSGIRRIRSLADDRLLVLDAEAVRLVDDTGAVRTLFTLGSSGIAGDSIVDMIPKGRDVYLTLANQPMLMLAKDVLP